MICERLHVGPYPLPRHIDWLLIGTRHGVRQDQACVCLAQLSCRHITLEVQVDPVPADPDLPTHPTSRQPVTGWYRDQLNVCGDGPCLRVEPGCYLLGVDPCWGDRVKAPQQLAG